MPGQPPYGGSPQGPGGPQYPYALLPQRKKRHWVRSPKDEDADNDAAIVGSNGQTYTPDLSSIAGYTNFQSPRKTDGVQETAARTGGSVSAAATSRSYSSGRHNRERDHRRRISA
jgi:hypothetical protein